MSIRVVYTAYIYGIGSWNAQGWYTVALLATVSFHVITLGIDS